MSLLLLFNSVEVINRDAQLPAEYAAGVVAREALVPLEFAALARVYGGGFAAISEAPISALPEAAKQTLDRDAQLSMEFGGLETRVRDSRLPVEALASLLRDALLPVEALATLLRDAQLPAETMAQLIRDAQIPVETLAALLRDALLPLELAQGLLRDAQVPVEYSASALVQVFRDSNLPVEWLVAPTPFGNWIAVVGAVSWRPASWRAIPTPTGYEYRSEPERRSRPARRRRRRPAPVAESQVLVSSVSEEALRRSRATIRLYRRQLAQIEARETQQRADEQALLVLL